jgi:hypothetical protein
VSQTPDTVTIPQSSGTEHPAALHVRPPGNAFTWPFHQSHWFGSLIFLLIGFLPLPFPLILNFGWMMEASAREGQHNPDRLPRLRNLIGMWFHGVSYLLLLVLYFFIPYFIFTVFYSYELTAINDEILDWIAIWIGNVAAQWANTGLTLLPIPFRVQETPQELFGDLVFREFSAYWTVALLPFLYTVFAMAMFLAGLVRYAATRKIGSFFHPFKNLWLVTAHLPGFLWTILLMAVLNLLVLWLQFAGVVLWATVGMWVYAHLIGRLAARLKDSKAII